MDLTPVQIRGKRYAKGQKPARDLRKTRAKSKPKRTSLTSVILRAEKPQSCEAHQLSLLEALPHEILQYIFSLSANLALLAASLPLCTKLSTESLKSKVFTDVFTRRLEQTVNDNVSSYHLGSLSDISKLQSALLNLNWLTYPWIMAVFKRNPQAFICTKEGEPWLDTARVPVKLLKPPWTDEKCRFLGLLFRSQAYIDKTNSTDYEVACNGLTQAILDNSLSAVRSLLHFHGVHPASEHLRTAVLQAGCHQEVVECLLLHIESSDIDRTDKVVWGWIHQRKRLGDEKGAWLESQLKGK